MEELMEMLGRDGSCVIAVRRTRWSVDVKVYDHWTNKIIAEGHGPDLNSASEDAARKWRCAEEV